MEIAVVVAVVVIVVTELGACMVLTVTSLLLYDNNTCMYLSKFSFVTDYNYKAMLCEGQLSMLINTTRYPQFK